MSNEESPYEIELAEDAAAPEDTEFETEPEATQRDAHFPWIVGGLAVVALFVAACCIFVFGAYLIGRSTGDGAQPAPPPTESQLPQPIPTEAAPPEATPTPGQPAEPTAAPQPTLTTEPTLTPEATFTPEPTPIAPVVDYFKVTPEAIKVNGCVKISWSTGGATSWVNIMRDDVFLQENAPHSGALQDCPDEAGTYRYRIVAYNPEDDRVRADQIVTVSE